MAEDLPVCVALVSHNGGTYLTHTYAMAPTFTIENNGLGDTILQVFHADSESATEQMGGAECLAYLQFLTYYICTFGANNTEPADMSGRACLQWFQLQYVSERHA